MSNTAGSLIGIPIVFGKRVAVLGSALTACQLADFLSENGRVVTILAKDEELGADLPTTLQNRLLDRLESKKVRLLAAPSKAANLYSKKGCNVRWAHMTRLR